MSNKIELPSGGWAMLRDPKTLKHADRQKLYKGLDSNTPSLERGMIVADRLVALLVESWSFELIPPSIRFESIGELDVEDYDVLSKEAEAAGKKLFPSMAKTLESEADPKAITEDSSDSAG